MDDTDACGPVTRAVLSLGSNLGDRFGHLRDAVAGLGDAVLVVSGVYETLPWPPGEPGPAYLNAAVLVADAGADPHRWLVRARERERAAGRGRDPSRRSGHLTAAPRGDPPMRYAPRTLDVDVIMVWDAADQPVISDHPELTLPHPRAHLRAFVLRPWVDIQPYARLPGRGALTDLLRTDPVAADLPALRPRPDLRLEPDLRLPPDPRSAPDRRLESGA